MLTDFMLRSPFDELWALAHPFRPMVARQRLAGPPRTDLFRAADVVSDEDGWRVRVALPGIAPEHVHVAVAGNRVHIRAAEQERDGETVRYERELNVPETVDAQQITASCRHGLLELHLPLKESARPRQITVTTTEPKQIEA